MFSRLNQCGSRQGRDITISDNVQHQSQAAKGEAGGSEIAHKLVIRGVVTRAVDIDHSEGDHS